ncbi:zinc ABC transporter substrate-binding protein [Tumebacillus sp. ITR2]|uniref:Zinc ABC transporter substrate-binding protein n=1 Tax=Tumebacillus amylolyticus TaxID=2801339 RepID=A0ABS1J9Q1_9BACL|nr:metal ABC transporter substrate-binding protein [Tumebacillus amylolyticus]MBL0386984.1 zinc ABC transporter substrate-binding protein [Tumebacillus amylolyticus]
MKKWWKLAMCGLLTSSLFAVGCTDLNMNDDSDGPHKVRVVTSFYPMYEFAKQIGGDLVDVTVLVPSGMEPHDWEPKPKDVAKVQEADVFVYNGAGFESWVDNVLGTVTSPSLKVVEASNGIQLLENKDENHDGHEDAVAFGQPSQMMDPHVWLDPKLAQQEVRTIANALEKKDPAHAEVYKKNAADYIAQLADLDQAFTDEFTGAPNKEFVTSHTAFGYMAKSYGLTQVPIAGLSPEQEPSAGDMRDIVNLVKAHNVKTIFFETLASPKVAETVAREVGAKTGVLNPLEGLTEDEKAQGLDYIGVQKQNLTALKQALSEA